NPIEQAHIQIIIRKKSNCSGVVGNQSASGYFYSNFTAVIHLRQIPSLCNYQGANNYIAILADYGKSRNKAPA
ncbi:TPA: hypothetical protein ACRX9C_005122, partial [Klebsiella michiganensis]